MLLNFNISSLPELWVAISKIQEKGVDDNMGKGYNLVPVIAMACWAASADAMDRYTPDGQNRPEWVQLRRYSSPDEISNPVNIFVRLIVCDIGTVDYIVTMMKQEDGKWIADKIRNLKEETRMKNEILDDLFEYCIKRFLKEMSCHSHEYGYLIATESILHKASIDGMDIKNDLHNRMESLLKDCSLELRTHFLSQDDATDLPKISACQILGYIVGFDMKDFVKQQVTVALDKFFDRIYKVLSTNFAFGSSLYMENELGGIGDFKVASQFAHAANLDLSPTLENLKAHLSYQETVKVQDKIKSMISGYIPPNNPEKQDYVFQKSI